MMNLLIFAIGVLGGSAVTLIILGIQSGVGYFKVDPVEPDEGTYSIKINSTIDANMGSSLGYIKITNSQIK